MKKDSFLPEETLSPKVEATKKEYTITLEKYLAKVPPNNYDIDDLAVIVLVREKLNKQITFINNKYQSLEKLLYPDTDTDTAETEEDTDSKPEP